MDAILKLLREINDKLNIIMSHCYIQEGNKTISFMEIYQAMEKQSMPTSNDSPVTQKEFKEILDYAARTNKFTIDANKNMVVEYKGKVYKISSELRKQYEEG